MSGEVLLGTVELPGSSSNLFKFAKFMPKAAKVSLIPTTDIVNMKFLILFALLLSSVALPVSAAPRFNIASAEKLGDDDSEYFLDSGVEEELFAPSTRVADEDLESAIEETDHEMLDEEVVERGFKPRPDVKKRRGKRTPSSGISVELLLFRDPVRGPSYKYYVLADGVIMHYRAIFDTSQRFRFRQDTQDKTKRCIIRKYNRKCAKLPRFVTGCCITFVVRKCSGKLIRFESADPETQGEDEVKPPTNGSEPAPAERAIVPLTVVAGNPNPEVPFE